MSSRYPRSRTESKELTRRALLRAALKLLSRNSFDSLSLREVTREAGVSPTAFYRHFDDMEELGLVLVEESFGSLREMLRGARAQTEFDDRTIKRSLEVVTLYLHGHTAHFRFITRERHGGVRRLRRAIHRELSLFGDELAVDLASMPFVDSWSLDDRRMLAGLLVGTMVQMVAELLESESGDEDAIVGRAERQIRLAVLGIPAWKSATERV